MVIISVVNYAFYHQSSSGGKYPVDIDSYDCLPFLFENLEEAESLLEFLSGLFDSPPSASCFSIS